MLPEIGAYPPDERRFSQISLKSIHIVEQLGPRIPLLSRRRLQFFGGFHGINITQGRHNLEAQYDELAQKMKLSLTTFGPEGNILQKRRYKADNLGRFSLLIETTFGNMKIRERHKLVAFRFNTHIRPDTLFELTILEEILNELLPK